MNYDIEKQDRILFPLSFTKLLHWDA